MYRRQNDYSVLICVVLILLLVAVKVWGVQSQGSRRWLHLFIFNLQPSERMKVGIILFLSNYYHIIAYTPRDTTQDSGPTNAQS